VLCTRHGSILSKRQAKSVPEDISTITQREEDITLWPIARKSYTKYNRDAVEHTNRNSNTTKTCGKLIILVALLLVVLFM